MEKQYNFDEVQDELLAFFDEEFLEFDARSMILDCIDIFTFSNRKMLDFAMYPREIRMFISLAKYQHRTMSDMQFLDYINKNACLPNRKLQKWIITTILKSVVKAKELQNSINLLRSNSNYEYA
jgi:hypothetical protein